MNKSELRQQVKRTRLEMTDGEHTLKSRAIVDNLKKAADWPRVKTLHYFEPLQEMLEPDISGLITYLEDTYPDLKLFTPRLIKGKWEMVAARGGEEPSEFDVILVPALGFDPKTLHRIGYGGGYYDKFLATQPHARKIGVCFDLGRLDDLPAKPHDIALDEIITEL
jgi:5-formyltetrahydrofolate cyclo-ligase